MSHFVCGLASIGVIGPTSVGQDLTEEGQMDMEALEGLLGRLSLSEGNRVLDLGCGAGAISEYISDTTGTVVTGVDYAASAVKAANARTTNKRDRLRLH